jgi:LacI family transcriptional regulator
LAHNSLTPEQEYNSLRELSEKRVDGMILLRGFRDLSATVLKQMRKSTLPIVEISGAISEFDYVHQGYGEGALALMTHLLELGHKRIGFIYGVTVIEQGADRLNSYRQSLLESNLPYDESLVVRCGELLHSAYQATLELLQRPNRPTAILAINDLLAISVLRAAHDLGLRLPSDLSVAGFDGIPFTEYTIPRITGVAMVPEENGRDAVRLLLRRIRNPETSAGSC